MKKFFLCLLILCFFGGFIFFTGWTQLKLPKGTTNYGFVVSKLGGIHKNPVQKGKVTFNKAFLIPSNATLLNFSNEPYFMEKTISGSLLSADYYSKNSVYDFSYNFTFEMELHVNPEDVLILLEENLIHNQEDLNKYMNTIGQSICQDAAAIYLQNSRNNIDFIPEEFGIIELFKACKFNEKYPYISIDALSLKSSQIPDYKLYENIRLHLISEETE